MRPEPASEMSVDGQLAELLEEVKQLRNLFQRRLLEDKAKIRLYDELYAQLLVARGGLAEQLLSPLFRELLLVVDRVTALSTQKDVVLESIREELLELLERRDVYRLPVTSASFDPAFHEAVRTVPCDNQPPGAILEVVRPGFVHGTKLLRPARVVVAVPTLSVTEPTRTGEEGTEAIEQADSGQS